MNTQTIVEGIMYVSGNHPIVRECFSICHVLSPERDWSSCPHVELFYLDGFKRPYFLMTVDKLVDLYIIGDKDKGYNYHVIHVNGFSSEHLRISKGQLLKIINQSIQEQRDMYLPDALYQKLMFIKPDYSKDTLSTDDIHLFSRPNFSYTFFNKSPWTINAFNPYYVETPSYELSGKDILK